MDSLEPLERRIVGTLIEKELTTPAAYPLTLNALVAGCNQKQNRSPQGAWQEAQVDGSLSLLLVKGWVTNTDAAGRVLKWKQRAEQRLDLNQAELAVLAELLLRGAQQPGELRSRAARMHPLADQAALQQVLDALMRRTPPLVQRLTRRPGERTTRLTHTLTPADEAGAEEQELAAEVAAQPLPGPDVLQRLALLEAEVDTLRQALQELGWERSPADE